MVYEGTNDNRLKTINRAATTADTFRNENKLILICTQFNHSTFSPYIDARLLRGDSIYSELNISRD